MTEERVQPLPRAEFQGYLRRADEACRSMRADLEARRFNSAGTQAIQVVISSADALTVYHLGLRSTAQSHLATLDLLRRIPKEGMDSLRRQVAAVLDVKNAVQYEPGRISEALARRITTQAARVLDTAIRWTGGEGSL
jgi:hypothetical protein